jgi:hypothetical protein
VAPAELTPRQVAREFRRRLADGARLRPAGEARNDPESLLRVGYTPKHKLTLLDTVYYLANLRQNQDIRFFVAYVAQQRPDGEIRDLYPRIFYKDVSLVWRSASHFSRSDEENWIGKGDIGLLKVGGWEMEVSMEATTELPLEIQTALEDACRRARTVPHDDVAVELILRRAPDQRIAPYRDFTEPRRKARADRRNWINGGRSIARFTRKNDPTSLVFAKDFDPDFRNGIIERARSVSKLYGGRVDRFRILSRNRKVQYLFFAGPRQVWIAFPQATTTEIMSFGVRTIDVVADEDVFLPAYEYHFMDDSEEPPQLVSQIPPGFVGPQSPFDASRCDASPWIDRMPVVKRFRKQVLGGRRS